MQANLPHPPEQRSNTDLLGILLAKRETEGLTFGQHRLLLADVIREIAENIGVRRMGSIGELRTAAYLSSIWQKSGLLTWTDSFDVQTQITATTIILMLLSVSASIACIFSLLGALVLSALGVGLAVWIQYRDSPLITGKRMNIPNVIAIRKAPQVPRRRVVLVAPLDTNNVVNRFNRPWHQMLACAVQSGVLLIKLLDPAPLVNLLPYAHIQLGWLLWVSSGYLVVAAITEGYALRPRVTWGAVSHAGALAAQARIIDELDGLRHTEVWGVSTGASQTYAGIADLIERYPFDPQTTFFVVLSGIGRGTLCYTLPTGGGRSLTDPLLLELATEVRKTVGIDARVSRNPSVIRPLLKQNFRAIEFTCLDDEGYVPLQGFASDTVDAISLPIVERAVRAVVMMVRAIDALN